MKRPPQRVLVPIAILCALMGIIIGYFDIRVGVAAVAVSLIVLLFCLRALATDANKQQQVMDTVFTENATAAGRLIADVNIPCMIFDKSGRIIWRNAALLRFVADVDFNEHILHRTRRKAVKLLRKRQPVQRVDKFHLAFNIFYLICLQLSNKMDAET